MKVGERREEEGKGGRERRKGERRGRAYGRKRSWEEKKEEMML